MPRQITRYQYLLNALAKHNSDECLLWPYGKQTFGYGTLRFGDGYVDAHRLAFFLVHGRWPKPCALHKCDVPACFNPRHIFEGTRADNSKDAMRKGRARGKEQSGETNCMAKLTESQVLLIRAKYKKGVRGCGLRQLAKEFGVDMQAIHKIVRRERWAHI